MPKQVDYFRTKDERLPFALASVREGSQARGTALRALDAHLDLVFTG